MEEQDKRGGWRASSTPLAIFATLFALIAMWAFATPLMASPDETAHAIKAAAVVRGQPLGDQGEGQGAQSSVLVPGYIAQLPEKTCFRFQPTITADCANGVGEASAEPTIATTSAGNYNPMYYYVAGLPTLLMDGDAVVYAMRLLSAALCATFLTLTFWAAARLASARWVVVSGVVALTPMVLFLSASINPNALEIVTTAALFTNLAAGIERRERPGAPYGMHLLAAAVSGAVLANTRALSLVWLVAAILGVVLIYRRRAVMTILRTPAGLVCSAILLSASAASLAWLFYADSLDSLTGNGSAVTPEQAFLTMIERAFSLTREYIGVLGWMDTVLPDGVYFFWHFCLAAVLFAGVALTKGWARVGMLGLLASIVLLPALLQAQVITELGYIWQGRYVLALVVLALLYGGVAVEKTPFPSGKRSAAVASWVLTVLVLTHVYAFIFTLRRYTVGLDGTVNWTEMFSAEWQPVLSWQLLTLLYAAVLAYAASRLRRYLVHEPRVGSRSVPMA
ncbi:DUF2142 domain-containing protein [Arthrobacter cheniae]|nr:DUF2142 domain-containing protein [Arthrobacter cheniae]